MSTAIKENKTMKNNTYEKKGFLEVKEGSFNLWIASIVLTGALMFLCGTIIFATKNHNYILYAKGCVGFLILIELIFTVPVIKTICDEENFRYIITAFKEKDVSKLGHQEFEEWKVYTNDFQIDNKGHFNCNFETEDPDTCSYLADGIDSNEDYEFYLHSKTHFFKFNFYTKIYDRKEKKYLDGEAVKKFLPDFDIEDTE